MRRLFLIFFCFLVFALHAPSLLAYPAPPKLQAYSAVLMDSITGKVLYQKRCHAKRPPASTTKMMTAILAIEHTKPNDIACASQHACQTPFGSLHLKPGETLTMRDLLTGMLLRSANDAAMCVAENVAGSESKFVAMMNAKAHEIGAKDTHFANPHGLNDPRHYSTAYDLALIARYAIQYPLFDEIVRTRTTRIHRSIDVRDIGLRNTANFLWKFQGADGIKTGYTKQAGHCFVGSATRDGWRLISVVLDSKKAGQDTEALMQYGFAHFKPLIFARSTQPVGTAQVSGGVADTVDAVPAKDLVLVVHKELPAEAQRDIKINKVSAPIEKGTKVGTLTAYLNGKSVGSVDLVAGASVERTTAATIWLYIRRFLEFAAILLSGFIIYGTAIAKSARRRRRRVQARR